LGVSGVDIGHNRVPDPPERMTGMIGVVSGIHGSFAAEGVQDALLVYETRTNRWPRERPHDTPSGVPS
jgi:hypothetical protein